MDDSEGPTQQDKDWDNGIVSTDDHKFKGWGRAVSTNSQFPSVDLEGEEISFGRKSSNKVQIKHIAVSGLHCTIYRESLSGLVWVKDHSTNGTYLNNEKVGQGNKLLVSNGSEMVLIKNKEIKISYMIYTENSQAKPVDSRGPESKYDIREQLGTGAFAAVKLCINRQTGEKFAMKIIEKKKFAMNHGSKRDNALMDEVNILRKLNHKNIIGIQDVFETDEYLYLVLELVTGGDLFDKIVGLGPGKVFGETKTRQLFYQMLEATEYLHSQSIVHRDLKPENILLSTPTENALIKLSDFGLSRIVGEGSFMKTLCGTPQYLAPEVLSNDIQKKGYDKAVDLWSLGVILYILLSGIQPFSDDGRLLEQVKAGRYGFPNSQWKNVSPSAINLVKCLLTVDPGKRYTIEQVMKHPWILEGTINNNNINNNNNKRKAPSDEESSNNNNNSNNLSEEPKEQLQTKSTSNNKKRTAASRKKQAAGD